MNDEFETYSEMLMEWKKTKEELKKLQNDERAMRSALALYFFPNKKIGVNHFQLGFGWELIGEFTETIKVQEKAIEENQDTLDEYGIPDKIWRIKHELDKRVYNKLDDIQKNIVQLCLEIKDDFPQLKLEYKEPKKC